MIYLREAAQRALEALEFYKCCYGSSPAEEATITALRAALAEPVQEQVQEHEDWCASMTQLLLCDPPRKAPCNCKKKVAEPVKEPVAHSVIAGALFDFMGWLTSRRERIVLSSADNASPAVEAITEFAKMRGLSLDDAKVQDWNTYPPQRKPLTDDQLDDIAVAARRGNLYDLRIAIERAYGIWGDE